MFAESVVAMRVECAADFGPIVSAKVVLDELFLGRGRSYASAIRGSEALGCAAATPMTKLPVEGRGTRRDRRE